MVRPGIKMNLNVLFVFYSLSTCFFVATNTYILKDELQHNRFGNISFAKALYGSIPDTWDWRNHTGVTTVKDQGKCPACWAFSIIGCIESQMLIKYKKGLDLSEQMLVDCGKNGGCGNGGLVSGFANLVSQLGGVVSEQDYPYENHAGQCRDHNNMHKLSVMGFVRVPPDEEQMRQYVYRVGPLTAAINSKSMNDYPHNGAWIDTPKPQDCNPKDLTHTVLIVGYDTYVANGVRIPFWIIKNSWGTSWGHSGFYYLQRGQNTCGIASDIVYGIVG